MGAGFALVLPWYFNSRFFVASFLRMTVNNCCRLVAAGVLQCTFNVILSAAKDLLLPFRPNACFLHAAAL
jgi:hypothetical protein